jgi:thiosulfate reductase cytochrome b subunit
MREDAMSHDESVAMDQPAASPMIAGKAVAPLAEPVANARFKGRRQQPLPIRLVHWLNVLFIVLMAGSGLQILAAYPSLGPRGGQYSWYPFQGTPPPSWLRLGGWLAGARHWHFAIVWFFILNGLIYLGYMIASGEWRRRVFLPRRDTRNAVLQFAHYTRIRKTPPPPDFYNGLAGLCLIAAFVAIHLVLVLAHPREILHMITGGKRG